MDVGVPLRDELARSSHKLLAIVFIPSASELNLLPPNQPPPPPLPECSDGACVRDGWVTHQLIMGISDTMSLIECYAIQCLCPLLA